jgi:site-specific DNA recombinase
MERKIKQVVFYFRFSPRPNAEDCLSIETQRDKLRAWAALLDHQVVGEYEDREVSAKSTKNRPGLEKAIAHVCRIRGVLAVYSLSRLARKTADALEIAERLDKRHADLASLSERIDTTSAMGKFFFVIIAALAELERGIVVERTKTAMLHHQAAGRSMGRPDRAPFGFRAVPAENAQGEAYTALEPDPAEQAIIGRIRELAATGIGHREICRVLDAEGVDRRGKPWRGGHGLVATILARS